jgi:hypothetical protein
MKSKISKAARDKRYSTFRKMMVGMTSDFYRMTME